MNPFMLRSTHNKITAELQHKITNLSTKLNESEIAAANYFTVAANRQAELEVLKAAYAKTVKRKRKSK